MDIMYNIDILNPNHKFPARGIQEAVKEYGPLEHASYIAD
jgi:hypothetical protein